MFVIQDLEKQVKDIFENGTHEEKKRLYRICDITHSAGERAKSLGIVRNNQINKQEHLELFHKLHDEVTSEALRVLNTMKRKMSHEEYLFNFYMIYQMYDGKNRDSLFKKVLKIVEERVRKLKEEKKLKWITDENDCIEVFRVGTINGRSWMSCVSHLDNFIRYWKNNSKLSGLLKCRVYRKLVCEDDILIYCEHNSRNETECILSAKSLKDCSLTERVYETLNDNEFSVKDAQDKEIVSMKITTQKSAEGDSYTINAIKDTEYLFGIRDKNTGRMTGYDTVNLVREALVKSNKAGNKLARANKAINDMNFNQSVLAA